MYFRSTNVFFPGATINKMAFNYSSYIVFTISQKVACLQQCYIMYRSNSCLYKTKSKGR